MLLLPKVLFSILLLTVLHFYFCSCAVPDLTLQLTSKLAGMAPPHPASAQGAGYGTWRTSNITSRYKNNVGIVQKQEQGPNHDIDEDQDSRWSKSMVRSLT